MLLHSILLNRVIKEQGLSLIDISNIVALRRTPLFRVFTLTTVCVESEDRDRKGHLSTISIIVDKDSSSKRYEKVAASEWLVSGQELVESNSTSPKRNT